MKFWLICFSMMLACLGLAQDPPVSVASAVQDPTVKVSLSQTSARPNETVKGVAKVSFAPGLHAYQNPQKDQTIIPITLEATGAELAKIEYPVGTEKSIGGLPDKYAVHDGEIEIPFTLVAPEKAGPHEIKFSFGFQQCDEDNCYPPGTVEQTLKLEVAGEPVAKGAIETPTTTEPTGAKQTTPEPKQDGLGGMIKSAISKGEWPLAVGVLLLIGLLINLTPCVYPLIPITISFFTNQAKDQSTTRLALGFNYMLGIALSYGMVGGIAAATGGLFGQLFTYAWFNVLMGLLFIGMALSMFDLYQIGLPPVVQSQLKGRSGAVGALIMGLFVGIGAAPCAGPVIVALFTEVAKLNSPVLSIASFTLVGFGIGIPYFILAQIGSVKALPKAGGWMKTLKAMMGLAVIYFGIEYILKAFPSFATPANTKMIYAAFFLASAAFLVVWDKASTDVRTWRLKSAGILACGLLAGMQFASAPAYEAEWTKFTDESFAAAKASGKPIMIDATANWCAECKVIEAKVFSTPEFGKVTEGVQLLKIDLSTGVDKSYEEKVRKQFNIAGLPTIIFVKPGGEISQVVNGLESVKEVEEAIAKAKESN